LLFTRLLKTPDAFKEILQRIAEGVKADPTAYVEEIKVDKAAGKVQRAVYILGDLKRDSGLIDIGKETEHPSADGRMVKGKITLENDNTIVMHEKCADFEATITLTVSGDELTVKQSAAGVNAQTKYKRI